MPYINRNLPQVYTCSPSWNPLPPHSEYHPSGSSQCTSPKHPVSCIEPGLAIRFIYDIIHVSLPFSQIMPPSPSPTESKRLFCTSVSFLLSHIQGYHYHLSKFHIYALVWPIRQHIKKQRHYFVNKGLPSQGYGFSSGHVQMWELNCEESWVQKSWYFWTVVLQKTLESPLDCKEI